MNENEIISIISENMNVVSSAVTPIAGAIFSAIFFRNKTSTKEFEKVKAGLLQEVAEDLLESGKMTYTEFYKAKNFLEIARIADEEYNKIPHGEKKDNQDFDWFIRFYETVGNVSNEHMRKIWARILAGEINNPNTYSLRTIDLLKNINQKEAEIFGKVCSHCVNMGNHLLLPYYKNYMDKCGITYSDIMLLDEIGLINSDSNLILSFSLVPTPKILFTNNSLVITLASKDKTKNSSFKQFPLTSTGDELGTLVPNNISDELFIILAREIATDKSVAVGVHEIVSYRDGVLEHSPENLLEKSN